MLNKQSLSPCFTESTMLRDTGSGPYTGQGPRHQQLVTPAEMIFIPTQEGLIVETLRRILL